MSTKHETREAWLVAAAETLNDWIASETDLKPASRIQVSCGWPRRDRGGQVIGVCHPKQASMGVNHVFISPTQNDRVCILAVLLHELVHAADDCTHQHKGPFVKAIRALGLEGKPTHTHAGKELKARLSALAKELGPYPHSVLSAGIGPDKPQTTRMLKIVCPATKECGFIARTTRTQLDKVGLPTCACGRKMKEEKKDA